MRSSRIGSVISQSAESIPALSRSALSESEKVVIASASASSSKVNPREKASFASLPSPNLLQEIPAAASSPLRWILKVLSVRSVSDWKKEGEVGVERREARTYR